MEKANLLGLTAGLAGGGTVRVDATKLVLFTTENQKGSAATLRVVGPMRIQMMGITQTENENEALPMEREQGNWRVCPAQ